MNTTQTLLRTAGKGLSILVPGAEIHAGLWLELELHEELSIIWLYGSDQVRDSLLAIPMTFTNRLSTREAWERIVAAEQTADLRDLGISLPFNALERIETFFIRQAEERQTHDKETSRQKQAYRS